ncbi:MAG: hypothetical protein JXR96_28775 [Deltaproteobacteria bacterium]|nr:hypothetical protein [Deltaproteobacteria bacterium]
MTQHEKPEDRALAMCFERAVGSKQWPNRRVRVCPAGLHFVEILRELYQVLAPAGKPLPAEPVRFSACDLGPYSLSAAYLTAEGDGVLVLSQPRGFMPGMGETLTHILLVGSRMCMEVEDYWEDNIKDPETTEFHVRADSAQALERATGALGDALAARGPTSS